VLSGGGARGAYEAGVIAGIVDILRRMNQDGGPVEYSTSSSG
jgi:predicted patatin/cPLA2 family phospholipase